MTDIKPVAATDRLGVFTALMQHMREGNCCDNLNDERLFGRQTNRLVGSAQLAVEEVFGGDQNSFMMALFMQMALTTSVDDHSLILIHIERWLNGLLIEAGVIDNIEGPPDSKRTSP